jgi:3-methyladenine DNA glycosylase/8-oxoguanine DNA glycosylase
VRLYETTKMILDGKIDLSSLYKKPTETVREELLNLS